jgi:hypothetical protein
MITPPAAVPRMPSLARFIHGSSHACSTTIAPSPEERA